MGIAKMPKGGMKLIRRLIRYVAVNYKWSLLAVLVCILITSVTTLTSTLFTRTLIDDYILPLTQMSAFSSITSITRLALAALMVRFTKIIDSIISEERMVMT